MPHLEGQPQTPLQQLRVTLAPLIRDGRVDSKYVDALEQGTVADYLAESKPDAHKLFITQRVEEIYKGIKAGASPADCKAALAWLTQSA